MQAQPRCPRGSGRGGRTAGGPAFPGGDAAARGRRSVLARSPAAVAMVTAGCVAALTELTQWAARYGRGRPLLGRRRRWRIGGP